MKNGRYFQIPERPADLRSLWAAAEPLKAGHLPEWLTPEDSSDYRCLPALSFNSPAHDRRDYLNEVEEIECAGLIVDKESDHSAPRVYVPAPAVDENWSIAIYSGDCPVSLAPAKNLSNPVLSRDDIHDVPATLVADPFMLRVDRLWHMFFEVFNWRANKGEIGLATSHDGFEWNYQQIVLEEAFHLSYPYVFTWMDDYYMIPESYQAGSVRLYKADEFPLKWSFVTELIRGDYLVDSSVVRYRDIWWMFTDASPQQKHDTLRLFFADNLVGPWQEHPRSPIVYEDSTCARPAGRLVARNDGFIRFAQNCQPAYGTSVRAFQVTELTKSSYIEEEIAVGPIIGPSGENWNSCGMHHIDAHQLNDETWIACVDGWRIG